MSLKSNAQLSIADPLMGLLGGQLNKQPNQIELMPIDVDGSEFMEVAEPAPLLELEDSDGLDVGSDDVVIVIDDIPGAPPGTEDPVIEVDEEVKDSEPAKAGKWDWESEGFSNFVNWVSKKINEVPKHSGHSLPGVYRAKAYLDKLDDEISRAMRSDLDGELDADIIEGIRSEIEKGIDLLIDRAEKLESSSKNKKKKSNRKKSAEFEPGLIKEAQKISGVNGTFVTVPLLISRIARVCINGAVSGGHDLTDLFKRQCEKYKLNDREKAEVIQLLEDMGMPIREDRGFFSDEDVDVSSSGNFDWSANYNA